MTEDNQLLQQYTHDGSRPALDELVRRYLPMIYSSAVRQVNDRHLAEDVTQAVFLILSQKASTIRQGVAVGGWLLSVTRRAAVDAMRKRATQQRHEQAAAKSEVVLDVSSDWAMLAPSLDAAMSRLSQTDRDAIVLRYFQDMPFGEIAEELQLTEAAAQKRTLRAMDRLRGIFRRQGTMLSSSAIGLAIAGHANAETMSAGLGASIMSTVGGSSAVATQALSIVKGTIQTMTMAKVKLFGAVSAGVVSVAGAGMLMVMAMQTAPATIAAAPSPATAPSGASQPAARPTTFVAAPERGVVTLTGPWPVDLDRPAMISRPSIEPPPNTGWSGQELFRLAADGKPLPQSVLEWADRVRAGEIEWERKTGVDVLFSANQPQTYTYTRYPGIVLGPTRDEDWDQPDINALLQLLQQSEAQWREIDARPRRSGPNTAMDDRTAAAAGMAQNVDQAATIAVSSSLLHSLAFQANNGMAVASRPLPVMMSFRTRDGTVGLLRVIKRRPTDHMTYEVKQLGKMAEANVNGGGGN